MDAVVVERVGMVAVLRLERPDAMNCLSAEIRGGLEASVPELTADSAVRCLVLTGSGEAFCAGGDLRQMQERRAPLVKGRLDRVHKWARLLLECDKPVIAAVNGAAVGAGFSLAMLCDMLLVSDRAFFRAGFPAVGAAPDLGLAFTLPRSVGVARAKDILLTNRRVEADEAVAIGLANRRIAHAELLEQAIQLATELAAGPSTALGLAKSLVNRAVSREFGAFLEVEAMAQAIAFGSAEFAEGVDAFLAKRKPDFPGASG